MRVHFFTIVLDGMPWISFHYPMMTQLQCDWTWTVVEGVADNVGSTKWCNRIPARLSNDGTSQYLDTLKFDPRITVIRAPRWDGKDHMVNVALGNIKGEGLLWEIDADEIWRADQIERMRMMFLKMPDRNEAMFYCRYHVGMNIVTVGEDCYGNNTSYEWLRAWRFKHGMRFEKHEPPILTGCGRVPKPFTHAETRDADLVFTHYAYATEAALRFKQEYYGRESGKYKNAVEDWKRLQRNDKFPVRGIDFLPWVDDRVMFNRI